MSKDGFDQIVFESWSKFVGFGTPDAYFAAKLKFLKAELRKWRAKEYPRELKDLTDLKSKIHNLDLLVESRSVNNAERVERREGFQRILELEKLATLDLKQKSRIK